MNEFDQRLNELGNEGLFAESIRAVQVNVGLRCNQSCLHCHLRCAPTRTEVMDRPTMDHVVETIDRIGPDFVDVTGGAPELNPSFRWFVAALTERGHRVQVRTNLTVLHEPGLGTMPGFFREHEVQLVASMPCYLEENVRAQRGAGAYEKSLEAMRRLNALGYGRDPGLPLNLVYNPGGPFLPPDQSNLEQDYRRELGGRFDVEFTHLLTIANMPIGRFLDDLRRKGREQDYIQLLRQSFNPATVDGLMCRHQISVGWDGTLYDCDFNLSLGFPVNHGAPAHLDQFDKPALVERRIVTGSHCFGCTAGSGSSCRGALV